ncbi:T9SS type A sorting domain-containing protein [bacterium]|nr:T9SS type A sorting domain-containing protein [bacterium]
MIGLGTNFNTIGQEVETLVNQVMPAGFHKVTWNAQKMKSGVYFYQIEAGSFKKSYKLVLVK